MLQKISRTCENDGMAHQVINEQERFRIAFQGVGIGIGLVDEHGRFFEANNELCEMFGIAMDQVIGMSISDLPVPEDETPAHNPNKMTLRANPPHVSLDKRFVSTRGNVVWAEVTYRPACGLIEGPQFFVASFHDITDRKLLQIALEQQATLDPLTKALNRKSFADRADVELLRSGRDGSRLSMVMVDLDLFKTINDTYGHAAGDHVLGVFGEIARSSLRMMDLLGRWGGEEFLILLPNTGPSGAKRVSERIRKSLEGYTFPMGLRVTATMGVAARRAGENFAALVDRADAAMYQAKQSGRNRVVADAGDLRQESARRPNRFEPLELQWRKAYACGVPEIDAEHKELFRMANHILFNLSSDRDANGISVMVEELLAHIATHFTHEEQTLEAGGFPEVETHKQSHRKLFSQASDLAAQFRRGGTTAGAFLGFVIHDVMVRHMIQEDRKYYPWIKKPAPADIHQERLWN